MGDNHESAAVQRAYRELIRDYCDLETRHGFNDITDVPTMSEADQALALRANPDIANEIELDPKTVADILANGVDGSPFRTHWNLGSYLSFRLAIAVRKWALSDLQAESLRRIESAQDDYAQIYYGGNQMTRREQRMHEAGMRQKDFF